MTDKGSCQSDRNIGSTFRPHTPKVNAACIKKFDNISWTERVYLTKHSWNKSIASARVCTVYRLFRRVLNINRTDLNSAFDDSLGSF